MSRKPHWPADLDVTPECFEFEDRYFEELAAERCSALLDYAWGFYELEWALEALSVSEVGLERFRAILPDGTLVACDENEARSCGNVSVRHLPPGGSTIVHIGIPRGSPDAPNSARYSKERILVSDSSSGGEPVALEWLRPKISLHLEGEPLDAYVTLPGARIIRLGSGLVGIDPTFVPPILTIGASPFLRAELRRALDGLVGRRAALARPRTRDGKDHARLWLLSLIAGFMPRLADTIERRAHPHRAYLELAEILGALSAFTPAGDVKIASFDFDHIGPVFAQMFASLRAVLDTLYVDLYREVPLTRVDPNTLYAELKDPGILGMTFYLSVADDDLVRVREEVPRTFRVGAWSELKHVLLSHSNGVTLRPERTAPAALPHVDGSVYFLLEKDESFRSIFQTGEIGIHHPEPIPRGISLYAVEKGLA